MLKRVVIITVVVGTLAMCAFGAWVAPYLTYIDSRTTTTNQ